MKEHEAIKLVEATFNVAYGEEKFRLFIRNLFQNFTEYSLNSLEGKKIPEAFQNKIISYKRLFSFIDPEGMELDVLAVKLKNKKTLENARTMQRNFVARYLSGTTGGSIKDAAIIAFYTNESDEWRFSLVRKDYVLDEENNRINIELTPARRFSFLVGGNEKTYTAKKQLLPVLTGETETTLAELELAFNIETVTKEFFEQYRGLLLRLSASLDTVREQNQDVDSHLTLLHIRTSDLCKKLLGQIIFLYFLQKKGWLGVARKNKWGTGDKFFLRTLFEQCKDNEDDKFFDNYLEPLFYEALATERDGHYYSRFDCRIPFLNGGLFEPINGYAWQKYDFYIPNYIFSNNTKTKSGDIGDGIFDIFDRYNFTIREDESLEKEVAVDPEILGKVFESLLEIKERKLKGAFYTPREIVHYMCQESLINYLDSKLNLYKNLGKKNKHVPTEDIANFIFHGDLFREHDAVIESEGKEAISDDYQIPESIRKHANSIDCALADVKVCDPAIGSGAFPVGIMHEIVRARLTLLESGLIKHTNKTTSYEFKRQVIQNNLYGVDVEESAIEIAKLRLWLSLVVDEIDMDEVKPLPNLTYKIIKGNSLLGIEKNLFNIDALKKLEVLKDRYFDETSKSKKQKFKQDIDEIIKSFSKDGQFDFRIFFSEVFSKNGGFDIVIANPPYLEARSKEFKSEDKIAYQKDISLNWHSSRKFIPLGADLMIYFFPKALEIMKQDSCGCFITENSWLSTDYGEKFQRFMLDNSESMAIIDSKYRYFTGKEAPNINTVISFFSPKKSNNANKLSFIHVNDNLAKINKSLTSLSKKPNGKIKIKTYEYLDSDICDYKWGFLFHLPSWFLEPLNIIERCLNDEKTHIKFGQGLNITANHALTESNCLSFGLEKDSLIPFFRKESSFNILNSDYFLVDSNKISSDTRLRIEEAGFKTFLLSSNKRIPPKFILPRGIGRHFCALNNINAFSDSYVEIYVNNNLHWNELLSIWAYCNSSLFWLLREISGRKNLGGGMLKSESSDVSRLPIPYKRILPFCESLENIFENFTKRIPEKPKMEISLRDHIWLDKIVTNALGLADYDQKIRNELIKQISYREDKSTT